MSKGKEKCEIFKEIRKYVLKSMAWNTNHLIVHM